MCPATKQFIEFLEDLDAVEDDLAESVRIPNLDAEDKSSDKKICSRGAEGLAQTLGFKSRRPTSPTFTHEERQRAVCREQRRPG